MCTLWLRCRQLCFWISLLLRHTVILQLFWCNLKNVQLLNTLYFMSKSWCDYGLNFGFVSFSVLSFEFRVISNNEPVPNSTSSPECRERESHLSVWHRFYLFVPCTLSFVTLKTVFRDSWLLLRTCLTVRF